MTHGARVSTARGAWSVALAVGSVVIGWILSWVLVIALSPLGSMGERDYLGALRIGYIVLFLLICATTIVAMVLGTQSIDIAWRRKGQPGRTAALALGWIGLGFSTMGGGLYLIALGLAILAW